MKILLFTAGAFAPNNVIGAIRWSKITKYLSDDKTHITVIAEKNYAKKIDDTLSCGLSKYTSVIYTEQKWFEILLQKACFYALKLNGKTKEQANEIFCNTMLTNRAFRFIGYIGYKKDAKKISKRLDENYDIVISTNPISAHWAAQYFVEKCRLPWIVDFRDPIINPKDVQTLYQLFLLKQQEKICSHANRIIVVSEGLKKIIGQNDHNVLDKIAVIYNGYDNADRVICNNNTESKLRLAYTGILYNGKMDLSVLFHTLSKLCETKELDKNDIIFDYAGNEYKVLEKQAEKHDMADILINHGYVSRQEALEIQASADVLVMATYNDADHPGVMTGKLFEYMMMKKPILAIVNGSAPGSEIKRVIERCDSGYCHESSFDSLEKLQEFVATVAKAKKRGHSLPYKFNDQCFDYRNIAEQVKDLIENAIGHKMN